MANILIRKGLLYFLGICITIFVLTFITSGFIRVNVENMGGNSYYPSYPLYEAYADENIVQSISMTDYLADNDITPALDAKGYDGSVLDWHGEMPDTLSFLIDVPVAGTYSLALDFLSSTESVKPNEITVLINDELQTDSAENMQLLPRWATETEEVRFDSYHNQILARHESADHWSTIQLRDQLFLDVEPVTFDFVAGINEITITREQGEFLLGNIHIVEPDELKAYTEYRTLYGSADTNAVSLVLEAEEYTYKNSIAILPGIEKSPSVSPFSSENNYMNIIASSFSDTGNRLTYAFEVETEGDYEITLKYKNDTYSNRASFRNIYIDDQIPFAELADYKFEYASKWTNETLGDEEGTYKIHLDQGVHYLALEASSGVFADDYRRILEIIDEISEYSLELKRLTGGESDVNREWDIESFLPDTSEMLSVWNDDLESIYENLRLLNSKPRSSTELLKQIELVIQKLDEIRDDIDEIPHKMNLLSEGSNSMSQLLALASAQILEQPLELDKIMIHGSDYLVPRPQAGFFKELIADMQVYRRSAQLEVREDYDVDIWVNRSRYYINMMQQMADAYFTPESGFKVRLSVMPNESKLILANAANTQPDLALGVSGWLPYEVGLRGAAADMRQFEGFEEVIANFMPGSLLHMMHDNKVYGLPETQDFNITFYRKDIFDSLELEVPETYEEIIDILPKLQRYGMNYYLPLSADSALKGFAMTAPFIYQFGGDYYSADGFSAAIDSKEALEGINMMVDLYTVYSLPLQTPNFYNSFREGLLPIGVATFNTYVQLLFAAPEINNKWDIALAPGVRQDDQTVARDTVGTAQSSIIFEKSEKKTEAWEFLKWWMSTDIQTKFTQDLLVTFGPGFLWNSANFNAFRELPLDERHIDIILEQWTHLREVPKIPGGYKMERELSNVWNRVVFDGIDVRSAVDDAIIIIDRELERKYAEFGYMDSSGNVLKEYIMPTKETVIEWQEAAAADGGD